MRDIQNKLLNGTQALPLNWIRGDIEKGSYLGTTFYVHSELGKSSGFRYMNYSEMPAEVWNHQLMAVDVDSESSIEEYLIKFGFPFSPARNSPDSLYFFDNLFRERCLKAIGRTQVIQDNDCPSLFPMRSTPEAADLDPAITLEEAATTIEAFQIVVRNLEDVIKLNADLFRFDSFINAGASNPFVSVLGGAVYIDRRDNMPLPSCGMLSSAICNQIIEALRDPVPWKLCACEGCGKAFKRKQGAKNPSSVSEYCCVACEQRQRKRNQRAAAKNRIQH